MYKTTIESKHLPMQFLKYMPKLWTNQFLHQQFEKTQVKKTNQKSQQLHSKCKHYRTQ